MIFEPVDFIAKLAALVPKPRVNLTRFHGVFAPNSKHRARVTPAKRGKGGGQVAAEPDEKTPGQRRQMVQDHAGVRASEQLLREMIQAEIDLGIPSERILLAGFSQGGAIALQAGLRYERPLAGIMGLSTLLPLADSLAAEAADENRATPIMLAHGAQDPVIPIELAIRSRNALQQMDYSVDWFEYAMPHSVCMEELMDVRTWILECLA